MTQIERALSEIVAKVLRIKPVVVDPSAPITDFERQCADIFMEGFAKRIRETVK